MTRHYEFTKEKKKKEKKKEATEESGDTICKSICSTTGTEAVSEGSADCQKEIFCDKC
ncbi:MAG: hypothetical protein HDR23_01220 [Lachnospiraceae bacterium]|nr:hypothetical protein [Lachnospiraceae bacterium]MBD5455096.1 hypothetical protein [Lachnospiraceae bacterium]